MKVIYQKKYRYVFNLKEINKIRDVEMLRFFVVVADFIGRGAYTLSISRMMEKLIL